MTLDSNLSKAVYQGNGSTTVFPFAFKVWDSSQIAVTVTDAAGVRTDVTSNSTVTLTSSGGSVSYPKTGAPLPSGAKLAITRNMPFTQGINLTTASRFDPQVLEDGLDQATAERQQILEQMARAVILPATSDETPQDVVLAVYAARDDATAAASSASGSQSAAAVSAGSAADSAATAAQIVEAATAEAITAASNYADAAAHSAADAAQSALDAAAAVPDNLVLRVEQVEEKTQPATTTSRGISRVATLADMEPGAVVENGPAVLAAGSEALDSLADLFYKTGDLVPSFATTRAGFLLCNGGEYSRVTYAELFAIIGTAFGSGDGTSTFNVPDFRGKTIQGANDNLMAVLAAGLPNATGMIGGAGIGVNIWGTSVPSGVCAGTLASNPIGGTPNGGSLYNVDISLQRGNPIFGASTTVQPPAIASNIFIKF